MISFSLDFRKVFFFFLMSFSICTSIVDAEVNDFSNDLISGDNRINEDLKFSKMITFEKVIFKTDEIIAKFYSIFENVKYEIFKGHIENLQRINNKVVEVYYKKDYTDLKSFISLKNELKVLYEKINQLLERYIKEDDFAFCEEEKIIIKNATILLLNINKDLEQVSIMLGNNNVELDIRGNEEKKN